MFVTTLQQPQILPNAHQGFSSPNQLVNQYQPQAKHVNGMELTVWLM